MIFGLLLGKILIFFLLGVELDFYNVKNYYKSKNYKSCEVPVIFLDYHFILPHGRKFAVSDLIG